MSIDTTEQTIAHRLQIAIDKLEAAATELSDLILLFGDDAIPRPECVNKLGLGSISDKLRLAKFIVAASRLASQTEVVDDSIAGEWGDDEAGGM